MDNKYLNKLEFNKILEDLASFSITNKGKDACFKLLPSTFIDEVSILQKETTEAYTLLLRKSLPPLCPISNIDNNIKVLKSQGVLGTESLLNLANILKISRELKEYISSNIDVSFSTIVAKYFYNLYTNIQIEHTIFSAIIDENTIDDRASDNLYIIRKNIKNLENDIRQKLNSFLNSKYIQEPIITIRNNRYVIPVKQEYKSEVKGLLHDTSSSGSTLFIEPISVFELNNSLNSLKAKETVEIEIILSKLSALFYDITEQIESNILQITKIDFAFAKAKYANSINGTEPILNDKKQINLKNARHPLIDKNKVVPITISIGNTFNSLVITGPNTGGKTVTLKTVGLLTIMAMCGLYIPADEKSSIYVFDNVYADIGDDQSILESLSTFSSHITNIVEILKNATDKSLVLLDELGSGTDPIEGSSLAVSILEYLSKSNILTIATTHYPEVKNYALINPNFENASCEFDINTLSPTYRLLIGVPGRSMAFEISRKLGLSSSILENAESRINENTLHFEDILKEIYNDKISIQKEKEKIENYSKKIEETKNILDQKKDNIFKKENEIIADAKIKARNILLETKEKTDEIIKKINSASSSDASKIRENLNAQIKKMSTLNLQNNTENKSIPSSDIKENMVVWVTNLNQEGIVLKLPNKNNLVLVQIGNMKLTIPLTNLTLSNSSKSKTNSKSSNISTSSKIDSKNIKSELNVIGLNVDEAVLLIDKYLDDAKICHLPSVRIIHGKGSGALRKGIHTFLKTNKHVQSFRLGTFGEGEMGVTVVYIR